MTCEMQLKEQKEIDGSLDTHTKSEHNDTSVSCTMLVGLI
jgi:hypothetical protein